LEQRSLAACRSRGTVLIGGFPELPNWMMRRDARGRLPEAAMQTRCCDAGLADGFPELRRSARQRLLGAPMQTDALPEAAMQRSPTAPQSCDTTLTDGPLKLQ